MKLKTFDSSTVPTRASNVMPRIKINSKSGLFSINKGACKLMSLSSKDQVVFHQDEEEPGDWYLEKVKRDGFQLREQKIKTSSLVLNTVFLAKQIFDSNDYKGTSGNLLIAGKPTKVGARVLYGLLTSSLKK